MTGRTDDVDEQLAGEIAQPETRAHLPAVDRNGAGAIAAGFAPFGDNLAIAVEQRQPAADLAGPVARPIVRGDDPRVQRLGVAEEGKVGREIERVEIGPAVGEASLRQAHNIEGQNLRPGREIGLELSDQPLGVEAGDQHRPGAAAGKIGDRAGGMAKDRRSDPSEVLDKGSRDLDTVERVNLGKAFRGALRVDDRRRARASKRGDESARRTGRVRMGQRLVQRVAAAQIVEGIDAQRHCPADCDFRNCRAILHRPGGANTCGWLRRAAVPVGAARPGTQAAHGNAQEAQPGSGSPAPRQRRPSPHRSDSARR